ncbi:4-carboxymuconolactone decarboxylase [Novosphingobium sp. PhB165]|uniref:carboxymuconolactone decarboxylase family protein n=1 Tax=Novosphingobium sp. PhB165 TaxID=2485105 RepID=UPI0010449255|nr:carboxymuconolactone decarboxylase family protein [Novosphingobium sp. PhB165]TCM14605.1 4-carboxymuconolactone decarboxylase [Novosphingobium sp. PhB165]
MALLDPQERTERGQTVAQAVTARDITAPVSPVEASWRDFVFAEIWNRPGLDRRTRYLIAIASAACSNGPADLLDDYIRGALSGGELSQIELREAALHLAVYTGWSRGFELDRAVTRVTAELGMTPCPFAPIRSEPWDPQVRIQEGIDEFDAVMGFPGPPPVTPYFEAGIDSFVFGEMWKRAGLDQRSRRWITLVGVSESCATTPIKTHFFAAMASGNCAPEELQEFVLQYAVHAGWPKASVIQSAVLAMIKNYKAGLGWDA